MKIEANVPLPTRASYPIAPMKVGDSFFVAGQGSQGQAAMHARAHGQYYGKKFSCRKEGDGIRIWRTA